MCTFFFGASSLLSEDCLTRLSLVFKWLLFSFVSSSWNFWTVYSSCLTVAAQISIPMRILYKVWIVRKCSLFLLEILLKFLFSLLILWFLNEYFLWPLSSTGYIEPVMVILHEREPTWAGRISWKHHTCMISALSVSTTLKQHPMIWSASVSNFYWKLFYCTFTLYINFDLLSKCRGYLELSNFHSLVLYMLQLFSWYIPSSVYPMPFWSWNSPYFHAYHPCLTF